MTTVRPRFLEAAPENSQPAENDSPTSSSSESNPAPPAASRFDGLRAPDGRRRPRRSLTVYEPDNTKRTQKRGHRFKVLRRNLNILYNVTRTRAIVLSWDAPRAPGGDATNFKIHYGEAMREHLPKTTEMSLRLAATAAEKCVAPTAEMLEHRIRKSLDAVAEARRELALLREAEAGAMAEGEE